MCYLIKVGVFSTSEIAYIQPAD